MERTIEYRYEFANGDVKEFSITQTNGLDAEELLKWIPILNDLDRQEYNNDKRESRRHLSLDAYDRDDNRITSDWDGFESCKEHELWESICDVLDAREVIVAELFFLKGFTPKEIALKCDFTERRAQQIICEARKKIKSFSKSLRI